MHVGFLIGPVGLLADASMVANWKITFPIFLFYWVHQMARGATSGDLLPWLLPSKWHSHHGDGIVPVLGFLCGNETPSVWSEHRQVVHLNAPNAA